MARLLAIDYGKKRTGLAVSDELQIIANGLTTVATVEKLDDTADLTVVIAKVNELVDALKTKNVIG